MSVALKMELGSAMVGYVLEWEMGRRLSVAEAKCLGYVMKVFIQIRQYHLMGQQIAPCHLPLLQFARLGRTGTAILSKHRKFSPSTNDLQMPIRPLHQYIRFLRKSVSSISHDYDYITV